MKEIGQNTQTFEVIYPQEWEEEYRRDRRVACWCNEYPELFKHALYGRGSAANYGMMSDWPGMDLFAQYALQYLLARDDIESLTMYSLAVKRPSAHIKRCWNRMRELMGNDLDKLRQHLIDGGFKTFEGEPDLFCWDSEGHWFFAEAKGPGDEMRQRQREWIDVYRMALPPKSGHSRVLAFARPMTETDRLASIFIERANARLLTFSENFLIFRSDYVYMWQEVWTAPI